jgi:hypothetical protein
MLVADVRNPDSLQRLAHITHHILLTTFDRFKPSGNINSHLTLLLPVDMAPRQAKPNTRKAERQPSRPKDQGKPFVPVTAYFG